MVFLIGLWLPNPSNAGGVPGDRNPTPTGTSSGGTPAVAVLLDGSGATVATYRRSGASSASTGSSGPVWRCWYFNATAGDGVIPGIDRSRVATVEVGKLYWLLCEDQTTQEVYLQMISWDPRNPLGNIAAADRAAEQARNLVVLMDPDIQTSPPAGRPHLVGLATWLWVSDAWKPRSASASLGAVTAEVTATPTKIQWNPGDGTPAFTCAGPGLAYDEMNPDRASPCSHTYRKRSTVTEAQGTFALSATITYAVHWQATTGDGGDLDPVTRTTTIPLLVREAQAVIE